MNDWIVITLILILSIGMAVPLGKYMALVYAGKKGGPGWLQPVEKFVFRICNIDPGRNMNWKQYLTAFFVINAIWLTWGFIILINQHNFPLNPADIPSMEWTLALNSSVSFLTSTNLQHYSGETGASNFSQLFVFMFLQFVSAAASMSVGVAVVRRPDLIFSYAYRIYCYPASCYTTGNKRKPSHSQYGSKYKRR